MKTIDPKILKVIKGSFHQGGLSIFDLSSVGQQCVPNCVIAALYSTLLPMAKWTSDVLDDTVQGSISLKYSKISVPMKCIETGLQLKELWYDYLVEVT